MIRKITSQSIWFGHFIWKFILLTDNFKLRTDRFECQTLNEKVCIPNGFACLFSSSSIPFSWRVWFLKSETFLESADGNQYCSTFIAKRMCIYIGKCVRTRDLNSTVFSFNFRIRNTCVQSVQLYSLVDLFKTTSEANWNESQFDRKQWRQWMSRFSISSLIVYIIENHSRNYVAIQREKKQDSNK